MARLYACPAPSAAVCRDGRWRDLLSAHVAPERRFWHKAVPVADCWLWTANLDDKGYGRFYPTRRKAVLAHRFAYMLMHGKVASEVVVRHTCDNPRCINPAHLLAGTQMDNVRDRDERGRTSRGREHYRWRDFSAEDIAAIAAGRAEGAPIETLAREYQTRKGTIKEILRGGRG